MGSAGLWSAGIDARFFACLVAFRGGEHLPSAPTALKLQQAVKWKLANILQMTSICWAPVSNIDEVSGVLTSSAAVPGNDVSLKPLQLTCIPAASSDLRRTTPTF